MHENQRGTVSNSTMSTLFRQPLTQGLYERSFNSSSLLLYGLPVHWRHCGRKIALESAMSCGSEPIERAPFSGEFAIAFCDAML